MYDNRTEYSNTDIPPLHIYFVAILANIYISTPEYVLHISILHRRTNHPTIRTAHQASYPVSAYLLRNKS